MKKSFWIILGILLLSGAVGWWFFRYVPEKTNLAKFAPADSLIYLEIHDLPKLLTSLANTQGWQKNAEIFQLPKTQNVSWLSSISGSLGIGAAETIVLSRAQTAFVLLGFEATEREQNLSLKPQVVIIAETHANQSTAQTAVENLVGKFAAKNFDEAKITRAEAEGASWTIWTDTPTNRKLFAAIIAGTAFIGNDEQAVKTCLAVKKGEKQNLETDANLREMRERLNEKDALAFGFVTTNGVKQLSEIGTAAYAGKITESETALSLIAQSFPPFVQKSVNSIGWTAKFADGKILDRYFLAMPEDLTANLQTPLATSIESTGEVVKFLPKDVYSFTRYNLQNPAKAWNGLIFASTTKLDTLSAAFVGKISGAVLAPYGIIEPNIFLNAVGTEIVTAKLSESDENALTIFTVRDAETLKIQILKRLQTDTPKIEQIGEASFYTSDATDFSAAFSENFLIVGIPENVRKVLEAKQKGEVLSADLVGKTRESSAVAVTFFDETNETNDFFRAVSSLKDATVKEKSGLAMSETKAVEKGFERRTKSNFGLFGSLVVRFGDNGTRTSVRSNQ